MQHVKLEAADHRHCDVFWVTTHNCNSWFETSQWGAVKLGGQQYNEAGLEKKILILFIWVFCDHDSFLFWEQVEAAVPPAQVKKLDFLFLI